MKMLILILSILLIPTFAAEAHGKEKHKADTVTSKSDNSVEPAAIDPAITNIEGNDSEIINHKEEKSSMAGLDEFPTLHPLVVHFPIVLLIVAFFTQMFGFFINKDVFNVLTLIFLIIGSIGAIASANYFHPHTEGLTASATKILELHETYAQYTVWASVIGTLVKAVSILLFKRKLIVELVCVLFILMSAISVSVTGHYGAQLIHIEGVGAQGKFLETHDHN